MIVYGRNPVHEVIKGPRAVSQIWATAAAAKEYWLREAGVPVRVVGAGELERRCGVSAHQGVCAQTAPYRYATVDQVLSRPEGVIVALDQIQDPQNLGAICRSAECAGARAVVIPERRAAEVTAAACKAAAGAVEYLPVARVPNLAGFLEQAKAAGRWCYGADGAAALAYDAVEYGPGPVLVLGSEGRGLRPRVASTCDVLVAIPMRGRIESLSVSAAAAVLLYAVVPSK